MKLLFKKKSNKKVLALLRTFLFDFFLMRIHLKL